MQNVNASFCSGDMLPRSYCCSLVIVETPPPPLTVVAEQLNTCQALGYAKKFKYMTNLIFQINLFYSYFTNEAQDLSN